ncbi:hypothetical protein KUTeg_013355 [Tegillarca granosa]|uniref:Uncharacterized protein n=1 Tax=Tegillarca granosa TaxID=220873 RepID=A0ABQ9ETF8_TEGGR|nr:hypothetical protein KUTeg_013355 [Tegillarca granosa]
MKQNETVADIRINDYVNIIFLCMKNDFQTCDHFHGGQSRDLCGSRLHFVEVFAGTTGNLASDIVFAGTIFKNFVIMNRVFTRTIFKNFVIE